MRQNIKKSYIINLIKKVINENINEGFKPSDSFEGQAVDDNGCMIPVNDMRAIKVSLLRIQNTLNNCLQ